jgi:hypothetical protein
MPVASLDKLIANKQPKLRVIFTNCCNKEQNGVSIKPLVALSTGPTVLSDYNSDAIKKLFLENKGKVMMTSSKLGQYSWGWNNNIGGLFVNFLLDELEALANGQLSPTWDTLCKSVHDKTTAFKGLKNGVIQEPYYLVSVNGSNRGSNSDSDSKVPPTTKSTNLFKALQTLVSHDYTEDQRLAKISDIQRTYFTSGAHVVTVGRNGTSKIMYEDVDDFLRRLALSSNIKQINILEGDNDGKNSIITVHEVRY